VCVAPDHDGEVRVVTLVNHAGLPRELDLTSYAEVCLNQRRADQAHPAFAKLFLETEFVASSGALLARRRPRAADQKPLWAVHVTAVEGLGTDALEYETDRVRFLGRGRTAAHPAALDPGVRLSGTTGPVLDPVFSLRRHVRLDPRATARVAFVTGAADTLETATALIQQFQSLGSADRAFSGARDRGRDELRDLGLTPGDLALFNRLAGAVVFTGSALRSPEAVAANRLGQPGLWPHAISGDRPIVLVRVAVADDEALVHQLVQWHGYVRHRGLDLDLVILDERSRDAADTLRAILEAGPARATLGTPGGLFVLSAGSIPADDTVLITAGARAVLGAGRGSLAEQIERRPTAAALRHYSRPPLRRPRKLPRRAQRLLRNYGFGTVSADSQRTAESMSSWLTARLRAARPFRRLPGPMCWPTLALDVW
jgi:cellobiose phosphorylase